MTKRIKVLVCEPGKLPYVKTIKNDWQDMSQIVGGFLEFVWIYPGAPVSIVCNDEGMIRGYASESSYIPCLSGWRSKVLRFDLRTVLPRWDGRSGHDLSDAGGDRAIK